MLDIGLLPQAIRRYAEGSDVSALKLKRRSSFYRLAKSLAYRLPSQSARPIIFCNNDKLELN